MKHFKRICRQFKFNLAVASLVAAGFLAGCRSVQVAGQLPSVGFHGINFENVEVDAAQHLRLDVVLRFRINDPYDVPLTLPPHQVQFKLDGHNVNGLTASAEQLIVPPHGAATLAYRFHFDLGASEFRNYLGRDVPYTLTAQVRPLSFADVTLTLEHSDTIRLPLLPVITFVPDQFAELSFLGDHAAETVDLSPIRDGMMRFAGGLLDPDSLPDLGLFSIPVKKAVETITSHLPGWNDFKTQWEALKTTNLKFISPNARVEGIQVTVPFRVMNPNDFAIEVPVFACGAGVQSASPFTSTKIIPQGASANAPLEAAARTVAGHGSKDMNLVVALHWADLSDASQRMDILQLMRPGGWQKELEFTGETIFDLGYGPTRIKLDLPVTLKRL